MGDPSIVASTNNRAEIPVGDGKVAIETVSGNGDAELDAPPQFSINARPCGRI
jgi:hypothetical protein